jgi:AmmeMemoRadiSam system protein B
MEDIMVRKPLVAGSFYPFTPDALQKMIEGMTDPDMEKRKAVCVVSPHAGFEYSGRVAGATFSSVFLPDKFILLGPSHRQVRSRFAIMAGGEWETPLGRIPVDSRLAKLILDSSEIIEEDNDAHEKEHSLEVQLPFIQYFKPDFSIVPITVDYFASFEDLHELGKAVSKAVKTSGEDIMIIASTDMSHYVSQETAKKKDDMAIEMILHLDPKGLYDVVTAERISMCGFQSTTAALVAAKDLGAEKVELVKYQTSGDVSGNYNEVVGYAGLRIG